MTIEDILQQAIQHNATDVHFCPSNLGYKVLIRIAGKLQPLTLEQDSYSLINRLKILADLDLSETRRNQEGQLQLKLNSSLYFIRVSIINTNKGEKVALRLLEQKNILPLHKLGLPTALQQCLEQTMTQQHGLILVCGATGAGKTTTLYACLEALNNGEKAIFTIEDPIEYEVDNFFQCQPAPAIGLTTIQLLKAFLRQDPDIILIGELRDAQTAQLAVNAALTGHMVFATLHSNSALSAIHRLQAWDVDFLALRSALCLILHQVMAFQEQTAKPKFQAIVPSWSEDQPPLSYQQVLDKKSMWHYFPEPKQPDTTNGNMTLPCDPINTTNTRQ
ncbi:protein transporter HofB [Marinomonas agarivorans]|nr:protein transporter HofB [Marinomonas agarivorans]